MSATLVIHPATKAEMDDLMDSMKLESDKSKEEVLKLVWFTGLVEVYLKQREINGNLSST